MWVLLLVGWTGGVSDSPPDCEWSLEVISVSGSWLTGGTSSIGRRLISLLFHVNVPLRVSTLYELGVISPPMVPRSLRSGNHTRSPGNAGDRSRALCWRSNPHFCFRLSSSFLSVRCILCVTRGLRASLDIGKFVVSLLLIRSFAGAYPLARGVDLYATSARYDSSLFLSNSSTVFTPH